MALSRKFHWVRVDRDKTPRIPKRLNVSAYPSLLVLGRNDENIHRFQSFMEPEDFVYELAVGLKRYRDYAAGRPWNLPPTRVPRICDEPGVTTLPAPSAKVPSGIVGYGDKLIVCQTGELLTLDRDSGKVLSRFASPRCQDITTDGKRLYAVEAGWTSGKPIHVLDATTGKVVREIVTKTNLGKRGSGARGICWRDGKLYVLHIYGQVFEVDPATGAVERSFDTEKKWVFGLCFDGQHFVCGSRDGLVFIDPSSFKVAREIKTYYRLRALGFAHDTYYMMEQPVFGYGTKQERIQVWPRKGETRIYRLPAKHGAR